MALLAPLNSIRFLAGKPTPHRILPTHPSRSRLRPQKSISRSRNSVVLTAAGSGSVGNRNGDEEEEEEEEIALGEEEVVFDAYSLLETRRKEEEEAMSKCREILFRDFCNYLDRREEEVKAMWAGTEAAAENKEEVDKRKMEWVRGFLGRWGSRYHPLSPKSAKEMLDEHIAAAGQSSVPLLRTGL